KIKHKILLGFCKTDRLKHQLSKYLIAKHFPNKIEKKYDYLKCLCSILTKYNLIFDIDLISNTLAVLKKEELLKIKNKNKNILSLALEHNQAILAAWLVKHCPDLIPNQGLQIQNLPNEVKIQINSLIPGSVKKGDLDQFDIPGGNHACSVCSAQHSLSILLKKRDVNNINKILLEGAKNYLKLIPSGSGFPELNTVFTLPVFSNKLQQKGFWHQDGQFMSKTNECKVNDLTPMIKYIKKNEVVILTYAGYTFEFYLNSTGKYCFFDSHTGTIRIFKNTSDFTNFLKFHHYFQPPDINGTEQEIKKALRIRSVPYIGLKQAKNYLKNHGGTALFSVITRKPGVNPEQPEEKKQPEKKEQKKLEVKPVLQINKNTSYKGEVKIVNGKNIKHGTGKTSFNYGKIIEEGEYENGIKKGVFKLISKQSKNIVFEKYENSKLIKTKLQKPDGSIWEGKIRNFKVQKGKCTIIFPDKSIFHGSIGNDGKLLTKDGKYVYPNGTKFQGKFSPKGKPIDGKGILIMPNGDKFEGVIKNGEPGGDKKGKYTFPDGSIFISSIKKKRVLICEIIIPGVINSFKGGVFFRAKFLKGKFELIANRKFDGKLKLQDIKLEEPLLNSIKDVIDKLKESFKNHVPENGKGIYSSLPNKVFKGQFKDGAPYEGQGEIDYFKNNRHEKFKGELKEGKKVFEGDFYKNGDRKQGIGYDEKGSRFYDGPWKNNKPNGIGKMFFKNDPSNVQYYGEVKNGKKDGKRANLYAIKVVRYTQPVKNWKQELKETMWLDKNVTDIEYIGPFKNGKKHGFGVQYDEKDKVIFQGNFKEGEFINGIQIDTKNKKWQVFKNNQLQGRPQEFDSTKSLEPYDYAIDWQDGLFSSEKPMEKNKIPHGKGRFVFIHDGVPVVHYDGEYKNGQKDGKGTLFYLNGNVEYEGGFKNGQKHGQGKEYWINGNLKYEGEFINGVPGKKGKNYDYFGKEKDLKPELTLEKVKMGLEKWKKAGVYIHWGVEVIPNQKNREKASKIIIEAFEKRSDKLVLKGLKLDSLPDIIGKMGFLKELDLSWNKLEKIPKWITKLTGLRKLDLRSNRLEDVGNIDNLENLEELVLKRNRFKTIPDGMKKLKKIKKLVLSDNMNINLAGIEKLQSLEVLKIFRIQKGGFFPCVVTELKNLKVLDISDNKYNELEGVENLTNLEELKACWNEFIEIPKGILALKKLKILNFLKNELQNITGIEQLTNLEDLNLSCNKLKKIEKNICNLKKLKVLSYSKTKLKEVPVEIKNLKNLEKLYLNCNDIKILPKEIGNLEKLQELWIKDNKNLEQTLPVIMAFFPKGSNIAIYKDKDFFKTKPENTKEAVKLFREICKNDFKIKIPEKKPTFDWATGFALSELTENEFNELKSILNEKNYEKNSKKGNLKEKIINLTKDNYKKTVFEKKEVSKLKRILLNFRKLRNKIEYDKKGFKPLNEYLYKFWDITDYPRNSKFLVTQMLEIINKMEKNKDFREWRLIDMFRALGECVDRVYSFFIKMQIALRQQSDIVNLKQIYESEKINLVEGLIYNYTQAKIKKLKQEGGNPDSIETYLHLLKEFANKIKLNITEMKFQSMSNIKEEDIKKVRGQINNIEENDVYGRLVENDRVKNKYENKFDEIDKGI
ncbi:NEL-type E3 ubiquitin ligase domain-containing protein, partial [Candidatus Margulisiibacteriota bacterium]